MSPRGAAPISWQQRRLATPGPNPRSACGNVAFVGCCHNNTVYYCLSGVLKQLDCTKYPQCGWNPANGYYGCRTDGGAEPSKKYPKACNFGDAGPPGDAGGADALKVACGNAKCEAGEYCDNCPKDCGPCDGCQARLGSGCPGCACAACVCQQDPYCCTNQWDSYCASECKNDCGGCGLGPSPDLWPSAPDKGSGCDHVTSTGCCQGETLWYCVSGTLRRVDCAAVSNPLCGWNKDFSYYDCGTTGGADPSGKSPMSCAGLLMDAGTVLTDARALDQSPDDALTAAEGALTRGEPILYLLGGGGCDCHMGRAGGFPPPVLLLIALLLRRRR